MPYNLDQLDFLGARLGVAIPPEFIENKRREQKFKQLSAELTARIDEIKQRQDGAKLEELLNRALQAGTDARDFAGALDLLDQLEIGLAAPDLPPPPTQPLPSVEQEQAEQEKETVVSAPPDPGTPEGAYRIEKAKLIGVINEAAGESADIGGEDVRSGIEKMEAKESAADWPAATELLRKTHQKAVLLSLRKPFITARQAHIHKINAAKKIKTTVPESEKAFGKHKTYGEAVTADWDAVLALVKKDDFQGAAAGIITLANKIDTKITPALAKACGDNATQLKGLKDELEKAKGKGDTQAMRALAEKIFKNTSDAEALGIDPGENARKPFEPDAVWTADKCEATFVAYDWFALKKCRKARKITVGGAELAFTDDHMWKLVQYRGKVVNEIIDSLRKEFPTLIAKASGSEDIESDIDITFATPGSGDDVKAAEKFNKAIKDRFKKPPGRVFDVNIYPRDYGAIKESFKADYNVEEIKDEAIDEPDQAESAKLSKIDQDVATLLKQRRFLDAEKFNEMLNSLLKQAPDKTTRDRIEKQYEEGEDIYLLTSLEKVEKIRAQVDMGEPSDDESKHKKSLRAKLALMDSLKSKSDRDSLANMQQLLPEVLDLFEEEMPAEAMDVTDALYLEKMGSLRADQQSIRSLKDETGSMDSHHPGQTCEEAHPKKEHDAWRSEHLNALEVKVKKDMFTNIVFANEAIMSQGALKHVVEALQAKTSEERAKALAKLDSSDLMQSVNEQVADLAKEMKHYEGVVDEAEESGDEGSKEAAKRVATGEGFVHASKYFFRLLDAAILLTEKFKDNVEVSAVVSKPYEALKTRKDLTLEVLKKRVDDVLLKLRKSAVIPPDVKGEVGAMEIQEIFLNVKDIPTFSKMITDFAIELNLRIRSMEDFKQSQEMQPKEGERLSEAEKAYFKAAAPKTEKPGQEPLPPEPEGQAKPPQADKEDPAEDDANIPPAPDGPAPKPIQPQKPAADPLDAMKRIQADARASQEIVRGSAGELHGLQNQYLDCQEKRTDVPNPGDEFDKLTAQMAQLIEDFKAANGRLDRAVVALLRSEQELKAVDVAAPDTAPAAVKLHAKATTELAERTKKALATRDQGANAQAKLIKAFADNVNFTAREGTKVYEPDAFELPSVLRDLDGKLAAATRQYRDAQQQLAPAVTRLNVLLDIASKGKPLPQGADNEIAGLETRAADFSKQFGKWNAAIIAPWRGVASQVKGLKKDEHAETLELYWRAEKSYDAFSSAYGDADETGKNILHLAKLLKGATAGAAASSAEANNELTKQIEAVNKVREIVSDPIGRLNDAKKLVADKKKQLAQVEATKLAALETALTDVNQELEKVRANLRALERAAGEAGLVEGLIKTRFSIKGVDKKKVETLKKVAGQVYKLASPALKEGVKTEAAMVALRDELTAKRAALGKAASVEDTVRLQAALKELPALPGKDTLLPAGGVKQWKGATTKGGDKKAATLFANVTKAWETAEKTADLNSLEALETAAAAFLSLFATLSQKGDPADTDKSRADKCREAQRLVRKMKLKLERDALPEPPWTEAQASKAKQIEACALLENGTPAKAPSAKGESDSFFIKNSEGKPAFIFKPKQGENVKEDLGGREGEGVVREVLTSKFNEQMKEMIGVDFGVCPTGIARLESDSFANGEKSKEKSRVGAMQQAAPNEGSLLDKLAADPGFAQTVKKEDVQKVAMMDFLTLQGDRNAGNLLVQEVNGEKRLIPIDGGFAFPDKQLFGMAAGGMSSEPVDFNKPAPTSEDELASAKGSLEGKNALMMLPQSQEKFSDVMLASIDALDPAALAKGLKQAKTEIGEAAPEVDGLIGDENIENVRRSALFLKKAAREFTVAELSEVYALDFKRVLEAPAKQLDKEIAAVIALGKKRAAFNRQVKADQNEYDQLGGDAEITKLGWQPKADRVLRLNLKRKIEILKKRETAPVKNVQPNPPTQPKTEDELQREFKALGGDKALDKVLARPDGNTPKLPKDVKLVGKVARLRLFKEFTDLGGDKTYAKVVALYKEHRYTPFDQLPKPGKAAVATFADWSSGDPETLGLGSKVDALKAFKEFSK